MSVEGEGEGLQDGTTQTSADGTAISKFKSAEDRDKAYLELEQKTTSQAQELAEMKRQLEDFSASQNMRQNQNQDQGQNQDQRFTDVYKSETELKQFWERFAQKPQEVFAERDARLLSEWERRQSAKDMARDAVSDFKTKHPDLAQYEEIVSVFVQRQPSNLSPRDRLERAAPEARKMIASIAQKGAPKGADNIDPSTFVESPSGSRDGAPRSSAPTQKSEEDELSEYMKERRDAMSGRLGLPSKGGAAA